MLNPLAKPISRRLLVTELAFIVVVALYASWEFTDLSLSTKLVGGEMEFLTSSAHYAARHLHQFGYIPLWQPYLGDGRPLIESPFAFVLNPFSTVPSLLFGDAIRGIKLSVVIYAVLAACGGWFCGRAFGLGTVGRLLMALLTLGKGNIVALLGIGHFQLGVAQVYIPWIIGSTFLVLRGHRQRWVIVLLGLSFALQFLAGNIWHTLPTLISVSVLVFAYVWWQGRFNWHALRSMGVASLLTIGISAMVLVPLWAHRNFVSGQDPTREGDKQAPPIMLIHQYFTSAPLVEQLEERDFASGEWESRYNYTVPGWFVLLLFVVPLYKPQSRDDWRLWLIGAVLLIFFTMWGIGGLQPFRWAYNNLPGLSRWRFVGRAFGMASFWLALLLSMRANGLWVALQHNAHLSKRIKQGAVGTLLVVSLMAGLRVVNQTWHHWVGLVPASQPNTACLQWLVARSDEFPLIVHQTNYTDVQIFIDVGVRHHPLAAAYRPLSVPYTYYNHDLRTEIYPRYAMPIRDITKDAFADIGYMPDDNAPNFTWPFTGESWSCLWEKPDEPPYAFSVRVDTVQDAATRLAPLRRDDIRSLTVIDRQSDIVSVAAQGYGGARGLAIVQEVAYPGWQAYLNGEAVPLESVGGYVGVLLPLTTDTQIVTFYYRPPLVILGGYITIATCAFCVLYLLHADRLALKR